MIGRWWAARQARQAKRLGQARSAAEWAELCAQPVFPDPPASVTQATEVAPLPPLWSHIWPPMPAPLPPRAAWTRRPAPPADPAWRAATALRPGDAVYPPPRRQPGVVGRGR